MPNDPSNTFIAHKAISLCEDLSGSEKRVAAAIIDHFNRKTGQCDPGLEKIAVLVCVSRRTVIRAVGSLVEKGYLCRLRHGGKFHRNQYEPDWDRFRAIEAQWNARRSKKVNKSEAPELSPSERQSCHVGGDIDVTQTLPRNSSKETLVVQQPARESCTAASVVTSVGLSKEVSRKESYVTANARFHVKSANSSDAAYDAAERRWNELLMTQVKAAPDIFANLIVAIDADLQHATTERELRKRGSGLPFLLNELDRRLPLGGAARAIAPARSTVPSGQRGASSNSDREGSPASSDFQSLKSLKSEPKEEPKQ